MPAQKPAGRVHGGGTDRICSLQRKGTSRTVDGTVKWYSRCGKQSGGSSKNKGRTTYDPASPVLVFTRR